MSIRPQIQIVVHDQTRVERQAVRRHHRESVQQHRLLMERSGAASPALLVWDPASDEGFVARTGTAWLRLLARLLATSLDRRLASGEAPEAGRLLAARADLLASLPVRRSVAEHWRTLSAHAAGPPVPRNPRVPLCRDRIVAADGLIQEMVPALSMALPVPARGVAMANWLLTDGAGPLYSRLCGTDLSAALRRVIELLDPAAALAGPE